MDSEGLDLPELAIEKPPASPFAKKASQKKRSAARARSFPRVPDARGAAARVNHHRKQIYRSTVLNTPVAPALVRFSSSNLRSPPAGRTTIARRISLRALRRLPHKESRKMPSRRSPLV